MDQAFEKREEGERRPCIGLDEDFGNWYVPHAALINRSVALKWCSLPNLSPGADLRRYITFADLVARLLLPDIAFSRHVELVHYDQSPFWPWWQLDTLPVRHLRPCENTTLPWECGELCRGAEELKQGTIQEDWLPVGDIKW